VAGMTVAHGKPVRPAGQMVQQVPPAVSQQSPQQLLSSQIPVVNTTLQKGNLPQTSDQKYYASGNANPTTTNVVGDPNRLVRPRNSYKRFGGQTVRTSRAAEPLQLNDMSQLAHVYQTVCRRFLSGHDTVYVHVANRELGVALYNNTEMAAQQGILTQAHLASLHFAEPVDLSQAAPPTPPQSVPGHQNPPNASSQMPATNEQIQEADL